jgi:hypothetical protein
LLPLDLPEEPGGGAAAAEPERESNGEPVH